ncbi:hypothetical protein [Brevundimonas sp. FT23028]|uniref:hypothetical protein n=1 Tax=Brevundimonas sp. FT23028 TaxID=3393748 RepID=UPI003B586DF4
MTGAEKSELIAAMMGQVCGFADVLFEGTNARFALVVWVEGCPAPAEAVAIAGDPAGKSEIATALTSAAEWAVREGAN